MRNSLVLFAIFSLALCAQNGQPPVAAPGGGKTPAPPKNLKVLTPADLGAGAMRNAASGLGVMCSFCHNMADMSSDEKPEKLTARSMFAMVKDINSKFPDGKAHVTCYTCHRGAQEPLTKPPAPAAGEGAAPPAAKN